jgi:hypothetical protein
MDSISTNCFHRLILITINNHNNLTISSIFFCYIQYNGIGIKKGQSFTKFACQSQNRKHYKRKVHGRSNCHFIQGKRKSKKGCALRAIYDNQIYENFLEINQKKSVNDKAIILKGLKSHFTFSSLIEDNVLK